MRKLARRCSSITAVWRISQVAFCAIALLLCSPIAWSQQDITIPGLNTYTVLGRGLTWGGTTGAVNNNFIFQVLNPNTQVCLYITNNNPSSSHSFTVALWQAGDPQVKSFQQFPAKWAQTITNQIFPKTVNAASTVGIFFNVSAAALLTAQFTGGTTQGGSPDTADLFAVQTTAGGCGLSSGTPVPVIGAQLQGTNQTAGNQFPVLIGGYASPGVAGNIEGLHLGTTGNGLLLDGSVCCQAFAAGFQGNPASNFMSLAGSINTQQEREQVVDVFNLGFFGQKGTAAGFVKTNFLEIASDQFWNGAGTVPAWVALGKITNPGANATLLEHFLTNAAAINPAYKTLVLSCSAACELLVQRVTARGTTCTAITAQNIQVGNGGTQQAPVAPDVTENACTGAPTASTAMFDLQLGAGLPATLDLTGFANFHSPTGNGSGISVQVVTALTGIATASLTWAEQ